MGESAAPSAREAGEAFSPEEPPEFHAAKTGIFGAPAGIGKDHVSLVDLLHLTGGPIPLFGRE